MTEKLGNLMKYRSAKYGKKYTLQRMASNMLARGWKMSERYSGLGLEGGVLKLFAELEVLGSGIV